MRQHYVDFLNREPDASGLSFWTNEITQCGADAACTDLKRIYVSGAFFLSIEFQETGYLVYRMYKISFGSLSGAPIPVAFNDFLRDTQQIGRDVQVGVGNWQAQLEANKEAFALGFAQRAEFLTAFPSSLTADQFVTQLDTNASGDLNAALLLAQENAVEMSVKMISLGVSPLTADEIAMKTFLYLESESEEAERAEELAEALGIPSQTPTNN